MASAGATLTNDSELNLVQEELRMVDLKIHSRSIRWASEWV